MKRLLVALALVLIAAVTAQAHGGLQISIGFPFFYPYGYPVGHSYYTPPPPPVYYVPYAPVPVVQRVYVHGYPFYNNRYGYGYNNRYGYGYNNRYGYGRGYAGYYRYRGYNGYYR